MRIRKKGISLILSVLMICMMLYTTGTAVYAADVDMSRSGSISITMRSGNEAVSGGSLVCYKVGYVNANSGYYSFKLTGDFSGSRVPLDDISDPDTADKLAQWAKKMRTSGLSQNIDENGHIVFDGLEPGLYLMVQDKAAEGYYKAVPFLVSVPMNESGRYIYDVEASPKVELVKMPEPNTPDTPDTPGEPTEPTKHRDPALPQTGQLNWPVPVMCISGLLLISVGILLRGRKTEDEG